MRTPLDEPKRHIPAHPYPEAREKRRQPGCANCKAVDVRFMVPFHGQTRKEAHSNCRRGFSLIELLCVMAIITILMSLMLPAVVGALRKAHGLGDHLGGPSGVEMRVDEVITNYTRYRAANPTHGKLSRKAFINQLQLSPAAETWLCLRSVEYRPFAAADPTQQVAIVVYPSAGSGSGDRLVFFTIRDLIVP